MTASIVGIADIGLGACFPIALIACTKVKNYQFLFISGFVMVRDVLIQFFPS